MLPSLPIGFGVLREREKMFGCFLPNEELIGSVRYSRDRDSAFGRRTGGNFPIF